MAAALRIALVMGLSCGPPGMSVGEEIPFVGPPAPAPPLIIKKFAGDVFNLDLFELHIPLDDDGDGVADAVVMPLLRNFEDPDFFRLNKKAEAILFRTRRGDATMEGSQHPRSELWERQKDTGTLAAWGSRDGRIHNLTTTLAFTRLPGKGSEVVALSVFGKDGEVLAIRLSEGDVLLSRAGLDPLVLETSYVAGRPLDLMILLDQGRVRTFRGTTPFAEWPLEQDGLHFRAGCVLEVEPSETSARDIAEVAIWKLYITHKGS